MIKSEIVAMLIILIAGLFLNSCTTKQITYGVVGVPAISMNGKYTAVLIAESEGTTYQKNGGFRATDYKNIYWLKLYETATGKLIKKKKLYEEKEPDTHTILCYGGYADKVWLHGDGLRAYNINTLEEVANQRTLAETNNFNANDFPDEQRFIDAMLDKGYINFRAIEGEEYRLQLNNLKIIKKKDVPKTAADAEVKIRYLLSRDDAFGTRCDTFNNSMFALAKDIQAAADCSPAHDDIHEVAYQMRLFKADYTMHRLGNHKSFSNQNITAVGTTTYLNPCFLKDTYVDKVIQLSNPAGYLIIHQDVMGSNSKAIITRVDIANKKVWETATGVSTKISDCVLKGKYCIITTNTNYMFSPHIGKDALSIIQIANGNLIIASLSD